MQTIILPYDSGYTHKRAHTHTQHTRTQMPHKSAFSAVGLPTARHSACSLLEAIQLITHLTKHPGTPPSFFPNNARGRWLL